MSDLESTVKALRHCAEYDCTTACPRSGVGEGCIRMLKQDAAAAIEELLNKLCDWCGACLGDGDPFNCEIIGTAIADAPDQSEGIPN